MTVFSSIFGNALYFCGALIGIVQGVIWLMGDDLSNRQKRMILAWVILLADYGLGRAYWAFARIFAPPW